MVIFFEINPPKVIENESNSDAQERMHNLVRKFDSILQTCGGVLVTDSVLGKPRFDPVKMACMIKESYPNLEIIASMRVIDKTDATVSQFVAKAHDKKINGILVIKGDSSHESVIVDILITLEIHDTVAFQAVTVGKKVADLVEKWNKEDRYTDAYYLHGFAVETAEALAEWTQRRIRTELGIGDSGLRYSWGFPSCPDVGQHKIVWDLLQPAKEIMDITSEGQIIPEQSTAAIVVHHPKAAYFTI